MTHRERRDTGYTAQIQIVCVYEVQGGPTTSRLAWTCPHCWAEEGTRHEATCPWRQGYEAAQRARRRERTGWVRRRGGVRP